MCISKRIAGSLPGLAKLWEVLSVEKLAADLKISRWKRDGIRVKGNVRAKIVQACVVTLDPVESEIDENFEHIFIPEDLEAGTRPVHGCRRNGARSRRSGSSGNVHRRYD